jgi:nickel transport protein
MPPPTRGLLLALLLCCLLTTDDALAHRLTIFAAVNGATIEGQIRMHGGDASRATILVEDRDGRLLSELSPGPEGRFSYQAAAPVFHRVIATTHDGHRAEVRIKAEELQAAFSETTAAAAPDGQRSSRGHGSEALQLSPDVELAVERAVGRALAPLREELHQTRTAIRLSDILGGIGYIVGIAGLALWWRSRTASGR